MIRRSALLLAVAGLGAIATTSGAVAQDKPNILIIWGDDLGWNNPSCYNRGKDGLPEMNTDEEELSLTAC